MASQPVTTAAPSISVAEVVAAASDDSEAARIRKDRARRATALFNRDLQPTLTAFARSLTGRPEIKVVAGASSCTDGKTIYIRPPIELGDLAAQRHGGHGVCEKRDENDRQRCEACHIREDVIITLYHEVGHIAHDSFETLDDEQRKAVIERAVKHAAKRASSGTRAEKLQRALEKRPPENYLEAAQAISPFLPVIVNALEDVRVNVKMYKSRPGTFPMFRGQAFDTFENGIDFNDGTGRQRWMDAPLNAQAVVGLFCKAAGYDYQNYFLPEIVAALDDKEISTILAKIPTVRSVAGIYDLALPALEALRRLGYCLAPEDVEDDKPEPEPEPDDEDTDGDDDDAGDGDGEADDENDGDDEGDGAGADGDEGDEPGESNGGGEGDFDGDEPGDDSGDGDDDSDADGDGDGDGEAGGPGLPGDGDAPKKGGKPSIPNAEQEYDESDGEPGDGDGADGEGDDDDDDTDGDDSDGDADGDGGDTSGDTGEPDADSDGETGEGGTDTRAEELPEGDHGESDGMGDAGFAAGGGDAISHSRVNDADEVDRWLKEMGDHSPPEPTPEDLADAREVARAVVQDEYFDEAASGVYTVRVHRLEEPLTISRTTYGGGIEEINLTAEMFFGNDDDRYRHYDESQLDDLLPEEALLGRSLLEMRVAFEANRKGDHQRNLKAGKVNGRVLGRRAGVGDPRLFHKKTIPAKRDYHVVIGLDVSGSTSGARLKMIKKSALALAELLHRTGVTFEMWAHTGNYHFEPDGGYVYRGPVDLDVAVLKDSNEPWGDKPKARLARLRSSSCNLDGHTLEFYRKRCDASNATDKVIMYFTDGAMPAENYDEELAVLKREITECERRRHTLLAVGICNEEPKQYGLDTARVDSMDDIPKVVMHLGKRLAQ